MPPTQQEVTDSGMSTQESSRRLATTQQPATARRAETSPAMPADTLQSDVPSVTLAQPKPPTEMAALGGMIEAIPDQFTENLNQQRQTAETGRNQSLDKFIQSLQNREGFESLSLRAEEEVGLQGVERELQEINNQIRQEQLSLRRARERVLAEGGQSKAQAQAQINNLERESFAKQADLAIIQMAKQGAFDSAKAIADRKAKAMFEQEENNLAALKFDYEENRDLFTRAEQRAFDVALGDRERKLNDDKERVQQITALALDALQNGAPTSLVTQMQSAKTIDEAISIGGQFIGALDREAKRASISASYASAANSRLSQRMNLMELAMAGDPQSISQLGYDPRQTGLTQAEVQQAESEIATAGVSLSVIDQLLQNERGIGAITGQIKSPGVSGFFQGGKADQGLATLFRFTPVIGNIQGSIQSRNDRDNALTDLTYIYNTEGFQTFIGFKESGLTFGSLTEGERGAIFAAANRLNSAIERDPQTGVVTGYRGTDDQLRNDLSLVAQGLEAYQEEKLSTLVLSPTERNEIANIR